jgi:hypothetical protein
MATRRCRGAQCEIMIVMGTLGIAGVPSMMERAIIGPVIAIAIIYFWVVKITD